MAPESGLKYRLALICLLVSVSGFSQPDHLNYSFPFLQEQFSQIYSGSDSSFHSAVKPYYSDQNFFNDTSINALVKGQLIRLKSNRGFTVGASPLLHLYAGQNGWVIGGGAILKAGWKEKWGGNLIFEAVRFGYSGYLDSLSEVENANPVYGFYNSPGTHFFSGIRGHITARPFSFLTLEAGKGKHFIGDGYRSMLLSDFAMAYPYLKMTTRFWRLSYTNLFTTFRNSDPTGIGFGQKYGALHYLDWNVADWFSFGFFEGVIYEPRRESGWDMQYLNPVILYRPLEYSLGSADNALMGTNLKITLRKKVVLYGQFMLDEFLLGELKADIKHELNPDDTTLRWGWWANKYGYQAGALLINPVRIQGINYSVRGEFNGARPFTYSHAHESQSYSAGGYALAHPLGANFRESLCIVNVSRDRLFVRGKWIHAVYGENENGINYGRDILESYTTRDSEYGHFTTQGSLTRLNHFQAEVGYILHAPSGLYLSAGWTTRNLNNSSENFLSINLRSSLFNDYMDR